MVAMMPTVSMLLFCGALWSKSASPKHLLPKLSCIITVNIFVERIARQLEEKWRIILEEESNSFSERCEGVNPWDFFPWTRYKSNYMRAEPKHSICLSTKSLSLDTILSRFQLQLIVTACCNEFHLAALHLPRSETENKSIKQVPGEECQWAVWHHMSIRWLLAISKFWDL
jgi:hypothetical protein